MLSGDLYNILNKWQYLYLFAIWQSIQVIDIKKGVTGQINLPPSKILLAVYAIFQY